MPVDRQAIHIAGVFLQLLIEPVTEAAIGQSAESLAILTANDDTPATAGCCGEDDGETLVLRAGPQGDLAVSRKAIDGYLRRVDWRSVAM